MTDRMSPRGRPKSVTRADILNAIQTISDPCFGKTEVAERVSVGPERTRELLNELVADGPLAAKMIGQSRVYWVDGR